MGEKEGGMRWIASDGNFQSEESSQAKGGGPW